VADRMADELEERLADSIEEAVETAAHPQSVPVNMYEAQEALVLVAPLPGVMPGDIRVEVHPGRVVLAADMRTAAPKDYLLHEWHYGPYERVVRIPPGWGGSAQATFGNGQLALRVTRGDPPEGGLQVAPSQP
jgi:HSP20 family molecular chaperone IbpA